MAKKLVIVESPAKSKTISQYLGKDFEVLSSVGHIRDLATKGKGGLGIDVDNNFEPTYEILKGKKKIVTELNKALKDSSELYLATDPDREGEAISWHLRETLKIKDQLVRRVEFNEITKEAILNAFDHTRDINEDLVSSQETRRMLDRIIGFKLSKLLQSKIKSRSAGRVQSAALKLIVDRERKIDAFVPEEYYEIYAMFKDIEAQLFKVDGKKPKISTNDQSKALLDRMIEEFTVSELSKRIIKNNPNKALTTSSLQQQASSRYSYSSSKTMSVAQKLYEGKDIGNETVGLITYMRTDSTRLSEGFVSRTRGFISDKYGKEYLGFYKESKKKQNVQDAHEAIRPTDINRTPKSIKSKLTSQEFKLYSLIYYKTLASLMKASKNEVTTLILDNENLLFKTTSSKQVFDGYLKALETIDNRTNQPQLDLSEFNEGDKLKADKVYDKQLFTKPPIRYTESRLIKEMEDLGIGRPSTYASTISTIMKRQYVEFKERKFFPTDQGLLTIDKLQKFFDEFISADYSRKMEEILDDIANGDEEQLKVLRDFYDYFMPLIEKAKEKMEKIEPEKTGEMCPECGSAMVYRLGRYGKFEACSNFPKCKYIKPNENSKEKAYNTEVECPNCHKGTLVLRTAKSGKNKGNQFLGCSRFPKCKYISPHNVVNEKCKDCDNVVVKDKDGKIFCIDGENCKQSQNHQN
ncbi:MAG: type I DNA topoisomerase [Tenericutes bacterium]|jgi:DNA topoisomerase-1|nr:type I DNA topoisomerase [Mycoplasmatota bacterium]